MKPEPMKKLFLALVALMGCMPANSPERAVARGTVLTLAEAVKAADLACASLAKRRMDADLADKCADAYAVARASVLAAADGLDAYDSVLAGQTTCAISRGVDALDTMAEAIEGGGGNVPAVVKDALELGKAVPCGK